MRKLSLNTGHQMPVLGLGTWQLTGRQARQVVSQALQIGYRHLDTADIYGNHHPVGQAVKKSGLDREDIFLTTKIWHNALAYQDLLDAAHRFQEELQTNYLDLLLLHWPNSSVPVSESLKALAHLQEEGTIRAFGVSNFTIRHLKKALKTDYQFSVNQVEYHPTLNQEKLRSFCYKNDIVVTAYSPLGRSQDLRFPLIKELADKYDTSPAQVILNWLMQKDLVVIPKASSKKHLQDNFNALNWQLKKEDIQKIDQLNSKKRLINPPFADF